MTKPITERMRNTRCEIDYNDSSWANQFQFGFSVVLGLMLEAMFTKHTIIEAQRDELLAACELGGFYDGKPVNGPQLLRDIADGLAAFKGMDGAVQVILAKANAEEAAITNLTNDQNCGRM